MEEIIVKQGFGDWFMNKIMNKSLVELYEFTPVVKLAQAIVDEAPDSYFKSKSTRFNSKSKLLKHICTITTKQTNTGRFYYCPIFINDRYTTHEKWDVFNEHFQKYAEKLYNTYK